MLALGLAWTAVIRVPLILNADDHLDSDLAVDGLTLLDAVNGHWRWHYPGTPHMGILPVIFSYPQALVCGANPITLVSGGTAIWLLVVVATFWPGVEGLWAVRRGLGDLAAGLLFDGDDLALRADHRRAPAHAGLAHPGVRRPPLARFERGGWRRAALLGVWCGLGLYLDAMFADHARRDRDGGGRSVGSRASRSRHRGSCWPRHSPAACFSACCRARSAGDVDPYDAYPAQFSATFDPSAVAGHAELLV